MKNGAGVQTVISEILQIAQKAVTDDYYNDNGKLQNAAIDAGYPDSENGYEGLNICCDTDKNGNLRLVIIINGLSLELNAREIDIEYE